MASDCNGITSVMTGQTETSYVLFRAEKANGESLQPGGWMKAIHTAGPANSCCDRVAQRTVHAPQLDLPVIGAGHDERQRRVERRPIDAAVMALQHVLHHRVAATEEIRVHLQALQLQRRAGFVTGLSSR